MSQRQESDDNNSQAQLYAQGIACLARSGYFVRREADGSHCMHDVFIRSAPKPCQGITYPADFRVYRKIQTASEEAGLVNALMKDRSVTAETQEFWLPVTQPGGTDLSRTELMAYSKRMLQIDANYSDQNAELPQEYGVQVDGFCAELTPRAFVPEEEWFNDELRALTFEQIFSLWPQAECDFLKLLIGRGLMGPSNAKLVGRQVPLRHTFRSVGVIVGEDAGMGKSTIFDYLFKAVGSVGYKHYNFRSLGDQFGLHDVVTSDFAYKDDLTPSSLKALVSSENTKTLASNGSMFVEAKFMRGFNVRSRSIVIANCNEWDARLAYSVDSGVVDRVKLLSTYYRHELLEKNMPLESIPRLAAECGASKEAVMLRACRLAVNTFQPYAEGEPLMNRVHYLTSLFRVQFNKDCTKSILLAMTFSHCLLSHLLSGGYGKNDPYEIPELSKQTLLEMIECFRMVSTDASFYRLRSLLKRHWELHNREDFHPWVGIRRLNLSTVEEFHRCAVGCIQQQTLLSDMVKQTFSTLILRDGFKGTQDIVWITKHYNSARAAASITEKLARLLEGIVVTNKDTDFRALFATHFRKFSMTNINDSYIKAASYSPDTVDKLLSDHSTDFIAENYDEQLSTDSGRPTY